MTKKFYEDLTDTRLHNLLTIEDLEEEIKESTGHTFVSYDRLNSYIEELINKEEINEVFLNSEEIEGLLTANQNQITFETYPPYDLPDNKYDETITVFTVPYSWYLAWLEETYDEEDIDDLEEGEDLDDWFHRVYTWDDTGEMYDEASDDELIIKETIKYRNGDPYPKKHNLSLTLDDIDYLYNLLDLHCAGLSYDGEMNEEETYDYNIADSIRTEIKKQMYNMKEPHFLF